MSWVKAALSYSAPLSPGGREDDWEIDGISTPDDVTSNFKTDTRAIRIHNLRHHQFFPSLDVNGFEMLQAPISVSQSGLLDQSENALAEYEHDVKKLLMTITAFDEIAFFDATLRCEDTSKINCEGRQRAHSRVHVDQNPISANARVNNHSHLARHFSRFQIINIWRPLVEPVRNFPLAVCDYRSIDASTDLVPTKLNFPAWLKDRENYSVKYNKKHKWYYWNKLSPDEVIVFKCYDSACGHLNRASHDRKKSKPTEIAGLCPHTSFFDEQGPKSGHLRTSLEVRVLVFHR